MAFFNLLNIISFSINIHTYIYHNYHLLNIITSALKFQIIDLKYQIINFSVRFLKYWVFYNI